MSALAKNESLLSSPFWVHLKMARSAHSYLRSSPIFPQCPPKCCISFLIPSLLFVKSSSLCRVSFWKADPEQAKISLVTSSFSRFGGQTSHSISIFCVYCTKSSLDGSNEGTSEANWLGTRLPSELCTLEVVAATSSSVEGIFTSKGHWMLLYGSSATSVIGLTPKPHWSVSRFSQAIFQALQSRQAILFSPPTIHKVKWSCSTAL